MENPIKMDDLGVPLFLETPIYDRDNRSSIGESSSLNTAQTLQTLSEASLEKRSCAHETRVVCAQLKWTLTSRNSGWWLNQPIWKKYVKMGIFHIIGVKIKSIWNHRLELH